MAYTPLLRHEVRVGMLDEEELKKEKELNDEGELDEEGEMPEDEVKEIDRIPLGHICYHLLHHENYTVDGNRVGICPFVEGDDPLV